MKKRGRFLYILLLAAITGLAQQEVKYFQVDKVKTITGEITEIKTEECYNKNDFIVIYLKEKTSKEIYRVEVSPQWFFNLDLMIGSKIEIAGSYSKTDEQNLLMAQSITFQGEIHQFRDKYGFPLWRGKGKRMKHGQQGKGKRRGRN